MNPVMDVERINRLGWRSARHEEVLDWGYRNGLPTTDARSFTYLDDGSVQVEHSPRFKDGEMHWLTTTHKVQSPPPWLEWDD